MVQSVLFCGGNTEVVVVFVVMADDDDEDTPGIGGGDCDEHDAARERATIATTVND